MAYNTTTTTTTTADGKVVKKTYYGGSIGPFDEDVIETETNIEPETPPTSKKSKIIIWGALIAAALFLFK